MIEKISKYLSKELIDFNKGLKKSLSTSVEEFEPVLEYIFSSQSKQIRPLLGILTSKMLGEFSLSQNIFLQAIELIHNATLFHDDVIDKSVISRNKTSLNEQF